MTPGIYPTLSNEDYHNDKGSYSRSSLMDFAESPKRYWANHLNPNRPIKPPTPAMILGSAFHTRVLEPDKFSDTYTSKPDKKLLKDVGRLEYDINESLIEVATKSGKTVISFDQHLTILKMQDALLNNQDARELIEGAVYESSYFWNDPATGLLLKARPDILHENIIVDLKSCSDASPKAFQRSMAEYGYHWQGAMIQDGVHELNKHFIPTVINICVETSYPHSVGIYIICPEALEIGRQKYKASLVALKDAIRLNCWNDFEPCTVGLPSWAT